MVYRLLDFSFFIKAALENRYNQVFSLTISFSSSKNGGINICYLDSKNETILDLAMATNMDDPTSDDIIENTIIIPFNYAVEILVNHKKDEPFLEEIIKEIIDYNDYIYDEEDDEVRVEDFNNMLDNLFKEEKVKKYNLMVS